MDCPSQSILMRFAEGALADAEQETVQAHVASCATCTAQLSNRRPPAPGQTETVEVLGPPPLPPGKEREREAAKERREKEGEEQEGAEDAARAKARGREPSPRLPRGSLLGRYVVLDLLGEGGMGEVYTAFDPELDRRVAVKLVKTREERSASRNESRRTRLLREAQAMARLSHPNVVSVYDVGMADGRVFLAMELVPGTTVKKWLAAAPRSARAIVEVFLAAGEGLKAAHQAGMIHRDLKPDNIFVGNDGRVRVGDFGLARAATDDLTPTPTPEALDELLGSRSLLSSPLTRTTALVGTPAYMAPEQYAGKAADARSDQFAFCVALYEALYGERPFRGDTVPEMVARIKKGEVAPPPKGRRVAPWLRRILLRGLHLDPAERFASMDELLRALRSDPSRTRKRNAAVAAVAVVLVAGAAGWRFVNSRAAAECAREGAVLKGLWDDDAREALEQAFLGTGKSYAPVIWKETSRLLSLHTQNLVAARVEVCLATRARREQSESVRALRMDCLDHKRDELREVTATFLATPGEVLHSAIGAVRRLDTLDDCNQVEALAASVPPPELRQNVDQLRAQLPELRAAAATLQFKRGAEKARRVADQARQLGHLPLQAEATLLLGDLSYGAREQTEAESAYLEALAASQQTNQRHVLAKAALGLMGAEDQLSRMEEARRWAALAEGAIKRINDNHELMCQYYKNLGTIDGHQGKYQEAWKSLTQALQSCAKLLKPDIYLTAAIYNNRAITARNLGNYKQARDDYEVALKSYIDVAGELHPDVARTYNNLGTLADTTDKPEEARAAYERSIQIYTDVEGPSSPRLANPLVGLGDLHLAQKRYAEALSIFQRALHLIGDKPEHNLWTSVMTLTGETYLGLGKLPEALSCLEASLETLERTGLKLGGIQGRTRFALARALTERAGRAPPRAVKLAQQAREEYAALSERAQALAEVEKWLKAHAP